MTEITDGSAARREYLRKTILRQHLEEVTLRHPTSAVVLASGLTYADAIAVSTNDGRGNPPAEGDLETRLAGGLSEVDLRRFASVSSHLNSSTLRAYLQEEMEKTLRSLARFYTAEESTDEQLLEAAFRLPVILLEEQARIDAAACDVASIRNRIEEVVHQINDVQPRLQSLLLQAMETLPHLMNSQRSAEFEELAMTIETCLLKLSLIRARAHTSLYQYHSEHHPNASMEKALSAYQERLQKKKELQEGEEQQLDAQLNEYEQLLRIVDGNGGSFAQVVQDMARVRKETEECRRDLRRLGWTGE